MSHLHIPDGVLPASLWGPGLLVALILVGIAGWATRSVTPQRVAYQGALGGLMLAVMSIPLGPLDYHLTLAGPIGVLLGAAGGFQVAFVACAILALMGHGGLTVIGLNTLVLGAGIAVARVTYGGLSRWLSPPACLGTSSAVGQAVSGGLWLAIVLLGVSGHAGEGRWLVDSTPRVGWFAGTAVALWMIGIVVESVVAFGLGRFLVRVRPGLLPGRGDSFAPAR